jgi:hypothetical protein
MQLQSAKGSKDALHWVTATVAVAKTVWRQLQDSPVACTYCARGADPEASPRTVSVDLSHAGDLTADALVRSLIPSLHAALINPKSLGVLSADLADAADSICVLYSLDTSYGDSAGSSSWGTLLWGPRGSSQTLEATGLSSRVQDAYRHLDAGTLGSAAQYLSLAEDMINAIGMQVGRTALLHPHNSIALEHCSTTWTNALVLFAAVITRSTLLAFASSTSRRCCSRGVAEDKNRILAEGVARG